MICFSSLGFASYFLLKPRLFCLAFTLGNWNRGCYFQHLLRLILCYLLWKQTQRHGSSIYSSPYKKIKRQWLLCATYVINGNSAHYFPTTFNFRSPFVLYSNTCVVFCSVLSSTKFGQTVLVCRDSHITSKFRFCRYLCLETIKTIVY